MGRSKTGPDQSTTTMGGKVKAVNGGRIRKVTITEIVDDLEIFKVWKHNLHVPRDQTEDVDILSTTHPSVLPSIECGQPTIKTTEVKKMETKASPQKLPPSTESRTHTVGGKVTKKCGIVKKQPSKAAVVTKQEIKKEIQPQTIPIPPPPPPPTKRPYQPVEPQKQMIPYVEKKPISVIPSPPPKPAAKAVIPPPPPMPATKTVIPLPDLSSKQVSMKPSVDFKPSAHSQRLLTKAEVPKPAVSSKESKSPLTAEQIYEYAKESSLKPSWQSLLLPTQEPSGRDGMKQKLSSQPEEIFQNWRYIFAEENPKKILKPDTNNLIDFEMIFEEWAGANMKEPELRKRTESEMETSPKVSKKETRKQIKSEYIEDDIIEMKENRRHDFARNASIKDKKRTDAFRKSTGKKIK